MEGKGGGGSLQKGRKVFLHQLHKEDMRTSRSLLMDSQVPNDVWMLDPAQELALPVKQFNVPLGHDGGVEDFGSTGEVVALSLAHHSVGPDTQNLVRENFDTLEAVRSVKMLVAHLLDTLLRSMYQKVVTESFG